MYKHNAKQLLRREAMVKTIHSNFFFQVKEHTLNVYNPMSLYFNKITKEHTLHASIVDCSVIIEFDELYFRDIIIQLET
jgi:hypothetical protein